MNSKEPLTESYYYILLCLYEGPNHGYGIMQKTADLTKNRVKIGAGTMYGAFTNLLKKGYIEVYTLSASDESRKKEYILTELGQNILMSELERLKELVINADALIKKGRISND